MTSRPRLLLMGAAAVSFAVDAYEGTLRGTGGTAFFQSSGPSSPGFIVLDCVVISDIGATGHALQASGEGDDGRRYYIGARDWGAISLGDWARIGNQPTEHECGAAVPDGGFSMFFPTAFATIPS